MLFNNIEFHFVRYNILFDNIIVRDAIFKESESTVGMNDYSVVGIKDNFNRRRNKRKNINR